MPEASPLEPAGFLGVDLGIVNIATTSDGTQYAGRRLNRSRQRQLELRRKLQRRGTKSEALTAATRKAAATKGPSTYQTRLASGEKPARKRMATLGAVYDAAPAPRRPHDVITPAISIHATGGGDAQGERRHRRRTGPTAVAKWLTGSIATTSQQVITQVFDQAHQRDPTGRRTRVVLVDGARYQLDLIQAEARRRSVDIHILIDFIHVLEYLWRAA